MAMDPALSDAIKTAQQGIETVNSDLQARPDYSSSPDFPDYSKNFQAYSQSLLIAEASDTLTAEIQADLLKQSNNDVMPIISNLIDANLATQKMGQLNTNRTITPKLAKANNENLFSEQTNIQELVALLSTTSLQSPETEENEAQAFRIPTEAEVTSRFMTWMGSLDGNSEASV